MASKQTETDLHEGLDARADFSDVLAGCRNGEREAQQRLYEACHRQVYRLMVRMVGLQEAADLTQQVFLQLFRKIDQFAGRSKFDTWLYRLAANEALQHFRKDQRWKFKPLAEEPAGRGDGDHRGEKKELLQQALARIDPELRSIFLLKETEELSYREIAESSEIPEGTVGSRLNRARRELQEVLKGLGWEP